MTTLRSSTRSTPRKTYTVDAFESIHDLLVETGSSSAASENEEDSASDDEHREQDFHAGAEPSEEDDDSMSGLDELGPLEEVDDAMSGDGDFDLDDDISIADDPDDPIDRSVRRPEDGRHVARKPLLAPDGQQLFVRGVPDWDLRLMNKITKRLHFFGPTPDDWEPVFRAQKRWEFDSCLPSRKERDDQGGFAYAEAYLKNIANANAEWKWYDQGGKYVFLKRQVMTPISSATANEYLVVDGTGERSFVMGPVADQKLYNMKIGDFLTLSDPFNGDSDEAFSRKAARPKYKPGFILNMGARVNCLDWAPNQAGSKQYLAVSLLPERHPDLASKSAPSFTPQEPHKSSIQILEFCCTAEDYIDKTIPPKSSIVLCTSICDIRGLKWCPAPGMDHSALGLLACISGDGALRVLDISRPGGGVETSHLLVEKVAFEVRPPNTICTSLTWLSSSRIAVACANGFVAVYDLSKPTTLEDENLDPDIFAPISTSYITSIAACYPSFPHMITATSLNGYTTLTNLNEPNPGSPTATALSQRSRISQYHLIWHDHSHTAISVEENTMVRALPLRRWFNALIVGRLNRSQATSMAVSLCHPSVLIGGGNGEVVGLNPTRKVVGGSRVETHQHVWFRHEWRRPNNEEREIAEGGEEEGTIKDVIGKGGLSRFVDGFKAVAVNLGPGDRSRGSRKQGTAFSTIHEIKTAVTALAWNPNLHVGGWAAAGMADGLLRVEDIAS